MILGELSLSTNYATVNVTIDPNKKLTDSSISLVISADVKIMDDLLNLFRQVSDDFKYNIVGSVFDLYVDLPDTLMTRALYKELLSDKYNDIILILVKSQTK